MLSIVGLLIVATMFIFAILFFGVLQDAGVFKPLISFLVSVSGGQRVAYVTRQFDIWSVYVYDRDAGTHTPIVQSFMRTIGDISPDGRFLVLISAARLTDLPWNTRNQIYLHDLETGINTMISVDNGGNPGNGDSAGAMVTSDNRFVAFSSEATNLVADDTNSIIDIFVHDRVARTTVRASVDSDGVQAVVPPGVRRDPFDPPLGSYGPSISADGSRVLFTSYADNLTPATPDRNGRRDVFLHELGRLPASRPFGQGPTGLVSMEAEHYYISLPGQSHWRPLPVDDYLDPWQIFGDAAASGGEAILADPDGPRTAAKPESPVAGYSIEFKRSGPHYVWLRGRSSGPQTDGLAVALNWGAPLPSQVEPHTGEWVWNRGESVVEVPSAGIHQLWLYRREAGVEVDKIVVTPDPSFEPTGEGPAESPRAGANASPILDAIGDQRVAAQATLTLALAATDPDGDLLAFTAPELPPFATLDDQGDGTATLTFAPAQGDVGTYAIRVLVTDSGAPPVSDEETFELEVFAADDDGDDDGGDGHDGGDGGGGDDGGDDDGGTDGPAPPPDDQNGDGGGGCFIATAAYGSYLHADVMVLRRFRDEYLLTNAPGRRFVSFYYEHSPPIAAYIAEREDLRFTTRIALTPMVYAVKAPGASGLFLVAMGVLWIRRRRSGAGTGITRARHRANRNAAGRARCSCNLWERSPDREPLRVRSTRSSPERRVGSTALDQPLILRSCRPARRRGGGTPHGWR